MKTQPKKFSPLWWIRQRAGAHETVVTFGDVILRFNNGHQREVVTHTNKGATTRDLYLSSKKAYAQVVLQLKEAGYRDPANRIEGRMGEFEEHWFLPNKAKCRTCGTQNDSRGIEAPEKICAQCSTPTKGNWTPVYVLPQGGEIPYIQNKGSDEPKSVSGLWQRPPHIEIYYANYD